MFSSSTTSSSRLKDIVGTKCILWSTQDVTCDVWHAGCNGINNQQKVLGYGTIGLAPSGSDNLIAKPSTIDYDCMSNIVSHVVAKIYPINHIDTKYPSIFGSATMIETNNGAVTLDVSLTGTPDGTKRALSIQTYGHLNKDSRSNVFAPLDRSAGRPPSNLRRVGDLGDTKAEMP
jgi:hypothetical protein